MTEHIAQEEKLKLLASVSLWENVPEERLASLAGYLKTESHGEGKTIFEEGSKGDGLYFISSGRVRIRKKMTMPDGSSAHKELALLGPGDCMGEMTLFEEVPRSAQAVACDGCVLLKLGRKELSQWLKANPAAAADFFIGLVQVLSRRLRRSSSELTLLFDISQWLMEPGASGRELLEKSLRHLLPHLEGEWSAEACLYNEFNNEMELAASEGAFADAGSHPAPPKIQSAENLWLDPRTYCAPLPGKKQLAGRMIFRSGAALSPEERDEAGLLLAAAARLIASALENIGHRDEELLRARLSSTREKYGSGL